MSLPFPDGPVIIIENGNLGAASYEPGSKLPLLYSSKKGCSMSRDMLKPLQNDTGHLKKRHPKTIPRRLAKRFGAPYMISTITTDK